MPNTVRFTQMKHGSAADYALLETLEQEYAAALPERLLAALQGLAGSLGGYRIDRLGHSLQAASRAEDDRADDETVLAALVHDIGDVLAPYNHSDYAAAVLKPYVRPELTWVVRHHGLFQEYYYAHHHGRDRNAREIHSQHRWYDSCVYFCEQYDQAAFDPAYPTRPLQHFAPLVREIFSRRPFDPAVVGDFRG